MPAGNGADGATALRTGARMGGCNAAGPGSSGARCRPPGSGFWRMPRGLPPVRRSSRFWRATISATLSVIP
ncbi:MAG: hypothetical protein AABM42_13080 [Actinomycetota bacterium]